MKKKFFLIDFAERIELNQPKSMFLDSGAFSLFTKVPEVQTSSKYYDKKKFYRYMDDYVKFVKKHGFMFSVYANVDAIGNAPITYRNQKYLESKGLNPLPVFHCGSDIKWLKRYIEEGYDYIALGGFAAAVASKLPDMDPKYWLDNIFDYICSNESRLPSVKIHGLALTAFPLLRRYPWYSVDSTSWTLTAGFGSIYVPLKKNGKWDFNRDPIQVKVTHDSKITKAGHPTDYNNLPPSGKKLVHDWLDYIQIPFGDRHVRRHKSSSNKTRYGVSTHYLDRRAANVRYFECFRHSLPDWPWRFRVSNRPSFT